MRVATPALRRPLLTALMVLPFMAGCGGDNDNDDDQPVNGGGTQVPASEAFPVQVGDVGPIAPDNVKQQPFGCQTFATDLGQPQIDNMEGIGYPVTDEGGAAPADHGAIDPGDIVGYSANCGAPTMVQYWYMPTGGGGLQRLADPTSPPSDVATIEIDGESVDYIVRQELGTLNRFIYSIFMITPDPDSDAGTPDLSAWNRNLIFHFGGGVGIGHSQGNGFNLDYVQQPDGRDINLPMLEAGYAIVSSTGTGTNTTYNLVLMGQTATMVKHQFVTAYAEPDNTFGVGGSGGAIQQLIYEQNHPDLLDGLVPVENFGDMITQINPVGDCELLEYYFDVVSPQVRGTANPKWNDWENRQHIEGLNAVNGADSDWDLNDDGVPIGSTAQAGTSECIEGWRGLSALTMNPHFVDGDTYQMLATTQPTVFSNTRFSYFEDLTNIFGIDPATTYAYTTYDNVGVQYGLEALKNGHIDVDEFLRLNAHVGGWEAPSRMEPEGFPLSRDPTDAVDPWSSRNATARDHMAADDVAPRSRGDIPAMYAAYRSGLVFLGNIDDPTILIDNYLEPEMDMHHSREKFEIRERMLAHDGEASNLVLWAIDGETETVLAERVLNAFELLEEWNSTGMKPVAATDACYQQDGTEIASGPDVWNGIFTDDTADDGSACVDQFPIYGSPRTVAGEGLTGWTFKCRTKSVETALNDGTYGDVSFTAAQEDRLREIFGQTGVCDYSLGDAGRPSGL